MNKIFGFVVLTIVLLGCESTEERSDRFFNLGNKALNDGAYDQAIEFYNQSLKAQPNYPEALNNRGVAKIESDHPYEAIIDYNQAIQQSPEYLDALFNRAYAYEEIGQFDKALKDVDAIHKLVKDSAFVFFYQGLVQTKMRRYQDALECFLVADSLNPAYPETLINIATIYYFKEEYNRAIELVNQAQDLSTDANAFNLLSLIELKRGNHQAALSEINRSLDVTPNEPYFLNNRGYIYLEMDSLELAIQDINRSIVLNPKNGWAYRNKAIYLSKLERYNEAIDLFNRAIKSGEFIDELYYHLGNTYKKLNRDDDACKAWSEGADLNEASSKRMLNQNCG